MSRPPVAALLLLAAASAGAGCMGHPPPCHDFAPHALVAFEWPGDNASMLQALRDLGWDVTPGVNSLSFKATILANGTLLRASGSYDSLDPVGTVGVGIEGPIGGADTEEAARALFEPALSPLVARFGEPAHGPTFTAGQRHCGTI